jgi:hypothetical protein
LDGICTKLGGLLAARTRFMKPVPELRRLVERLWAGNEELLPTEDDSAARSATGFRRTLQRIRPAPAQQDRRTRP